MPNEIGALGEAIFNVEISRDYIFRPKHLGDKWPSSDFYIELIGPKERFFFIVQVKSTTKGLDSNNKLKIQAPLAKLKSLNEYYCPTYLAGVDVNTDSVYLIPVNGILTLNINRLSTAFTLNQGNRQRLFNDVKNFWQNTNIKQFKEQFNHSI